MRKIEERLKEINMSVYKFAQLIGESQQTTRNIVKKKQFGKEHILLEKMCIVLDCDVRELLTDEEIKELNNL